MAARTRERKPNFTGTWESSSVEGLDAFLEARGVPYLKRLVAVPLQQTVTQVLRQTGTTDLVQQSTSKLSSFTQLQRCGATLANEDPSGGTVQLTAHWEGPVWCVTSVPTTGGAPIYLRRWLDASGTMWFETATPAAGAQAVGEQRDSAHLVRAIRKFTRVGGPPLEPIESAEEEQPATPAATPARHRVAPSGAPKQGAAVTSRAATQKASPALDVRTLEVSGRGQAAAPASAASYPRDDAPPPMRVSHTSDVDVYGDEEDIAELDTMTKPTALAAVQRSASMNGGIEGSRAVVAPQSSQMRHAAAVEVVEVETFENQRSVPGVGFSSAFLMAADPQAWSTADGRRGCCATAPDDGGSNSQALPLGWTWNGPWRVAPLGNNLPVDEQGWCYGPSFAALRDGGASAQEGPGTHVRSRRWIRPRVPAGSVSAASSGGVSTTPLKAQPMGRGQQHGPPMSPVMESPQQSPWSGTNQQQQQSRAAAIAQQDPLPPPIPELVAPADSSAGRMRSGRHGAGRVAGAEPMDRSFDSENSTTEAELHGRGAHAEWLRRSAAAAAIQGGTPFISASAPPSLSGRPGGVSISSDEGAAQVQEKPPWRLAEEEIAAALAATRARRAGSASGRGNSSRAPSSAGGGAGHGLGVDDAASVVTDVESDAGRGSIGSQPQRRAARDRLRRAGGGGSAPASVASDLDVPLSVIHASSGGSLRSAVEGSVPHGPVDPQNSIFSRAGTLDETLRRANVGADSLDRATPRSSVGRAPQYSTDTDGALTDSRRQGRARSRQSAPLVAPASVASVAGRRSRSEVQLSTKVSTPSPPLSWVDRVDDAVLAAQAAIAAVAWAAARSAWSAGTHLVTRHARAVVALLLAHILLMLVV